MIRSVIFMFFLVLFLLCSCGKKYEQSADNSCIRKSNHRLHITFFEQCCINNGLVNIADIDSTIKIKMIYSTDSNVMHFDAYGDFDKAYLQKEVAIKIANANKILKQIHPDFSLIIYDAARPLSVQKRLWDSVKMPDYKKANFVANPATGSLHNYGCAVDLSIVDAKAIPLDMGTDYDSDNELAYPMYEEKFLSAAKLSKQQIENRKLLRLIMKKAGFSATRTEWWHYNATSLQNAKSKFNIIP